MPFGFFCGLNVCSQRSDILDFNKQMKFIELGQIVFKSRGIIETIFDNSFSLAMMVRTSLTFVGIASSTTSCITGFSTLGNHYGGCFFCCR